MSMKRRHFLMFMGAGAGSIALQPFVQEGQFSSVSLQGAAATAQTLPTSLPFVPVKGPMPLATDGISLARQVSSYSSFAVKDDVVLPSGFTYDVVASWGDPVGDFHFGYNNDYVSFVETEPNEGYLTVSHEYISAKPWIQTYQQVIGKSLPIDTVTAAAGDAGVDAFSLADGDATKTAIQEVCQAALADLGASVISIRKGTNGAWTRTNSNEDRRIKGTSGLEDNRYLKTTGPAVAVFRKSSGTGYVDKLGDRVIGSFANCAGGTTPWGTVFIAEENFQTYVPEGANADGTSLSPSEVKFGINAEEITGLGNVFGLAGNKYGWMVEVDPSKPNDYGTKHTWLGRYRHEAVGIRAVEGRKLAFYSGCDRRGGHLYKFVSTDTVNSATRKSNSRLLSDGMLYAAKFNADGTGSWIALKADTPVNPDMPSSHSGGMITLPKRPDGGFMKVTDDAAIAPFKAQFRTLGDLYTGNATEKQGAILIDAHFAANAAGATCTARPEDTDVSQDGTLFITFTSGAPSSSDGGASNAIFKGPKGETNYEYGWVMKLNEDSNDPAAMTFTWAMFATGGEPIDGGQGFANPDNLEFDAKGNLWVVTDMSSDKHNKEISSRVDAEGKPVSQSNLRGLFGNNSIWYMPTSGANAGEAYLFGFGPTDAEMTGPFFTKDQTTLFIAAQHPGEVGGTRQGMKTEARKFAMKTLDGTEFMQTREVPVGSNWPGKQPTDPPKPSVIAIRRISGAAIS